MVSTKRFDELPDGKIASANDSYPDNLPGIPHPFSLIDKQTRDSWIKQDLKYG